MNDDGTEGLDTRPALMLAVALIGSACSSDDGSPTPTTEAGAEEVNSDEQARSAEGLGPRDGRDWHRRSQPAAPSPTAMSKKLIPAPPVYGNIPRIWISDRRANGEADFCTASSCDDHGTADLSGDRDRRMAERERDRGIAGLGLRRTRRSVARATRTLAVSAQAQGVIGGEAPWTSPSTKRPPPMPARWLPSGGPRTPASAQSSIARIRSTSGPTTRRTRRPSTIS